MARASASLFVVLSLQLVGCASDAQREPDPCARVGWSCRCDDALEGEIVCQGGAPVCSCARFVAPEGDDASDGSDAGATPVVDAASDAAVVDAAVADAAVADAGSDGGADASVPPRDAGSGPSAPDASAGPRVPSAPSACPTLKTGTITVLGQKVELRVGAKQSGRAGPLLFYWHRSGGDPDEVESGLGDAVVRTILAEGGVIASFDGTTKKGQNTGNGTWYTGDFEMADQILACAVAQQVVDPRRVYSAGCSVGGLQASAMVYARSSYLAGAMPSSGGILGSYTLENPSHVPALIAAHGHPWLDVGIADFAAATASQARDLARRGGMVVACDHGGDTCESPSSVKGAQWRFLSDHPFGVAPEPYAKGLPSTFPSSCEIVSE